MGDLQSWADSVKDDIEKNSRINQALSTHFLEEHTIYIYNIVGETLAKCLRGKELNSFIDFIRDKQEK